MTHTKLIYGKVSPRRAYLPRASAMRENAFQDVSLMVGSSSLMGMRSFPFFILLSKETF